MQNTRLRILYIDDDPGLRRLVQRELERVGFDCEVASGGEEGLVRLAEGGIDAVGLDQTMPGMDGLETLAKIQAREDAPPVIFVTASQDSRIAVSALKAGAADYVAKDVGGHFLALLRVAIDNALTARALQTAMREAEAEVRRARDRFEALATERAVLLREVNHRVGNSLQLIASMLQLQSNSAASGEIKAALLDARSRVHAVAEVHKRLYTSDDVKSVSLDQYLKALVEDLRRSSDDGLSNLTIDAEPLNLDPDRAVAIGVIVNELVLNALKHAYPNSHGPIKVGLTCVNGKHAELSVEDFGIGIRAAAETSSTGLGQRIVNAMAQKLRANVAQQPRETGTKVVILFEVTPEA
jgi:two-component sensor histidine kinase/CheY-like chemotaxis protein